MGAEAFGAPGDSPTWASSAKDFVTTARPEEVANVVAFLADDGASYLTATTIFADGGLMQSSVGL